MFTAITRSIARADNGGRALSPDRATGGGPGDGSVASRRFGIWSNAESYVSPARPQARAPTEAAVPLRRRWNGTDRRQEWEEVVA